jgi:hypothetical protein
MALGSTQPLTEMSTRNLPGGNGWPANNLTVICEPPRLTVLWVPTACNRDGFTFEVYEGRRFDSL